MAAPPTVGELPVIGRGMSYRIREGGSHYVLEDAARDGMSVADRVPDGDLRLVEAERGTIHDADGIGRRVPIRWYFPKGPYGMEEVLARAEEMDARYAAMRDTTCPG